MKRASTVLLVWIIMANALSAQDLHPNLRSLDNNAALAADTNDHPWSRAIKQIPLSANHSTHVSVGGEIREQVRLYRHLNHGDVLPGISDNDFFLLQRYMLHADLIMGSNFRLFGQLGSMHENGKNTLTHTDKDELAVMQAFAELNVSLPWGLRVRMGRQDLSYANERFLGTREGPNVRQAYDGVTASLFLKNTRADFLAVAPMINEYGIFDNRINHDVLHVGSYWTFQKGTHSGLDLYYFVSNRKTTVAACEKGKELRHTVGIRHYGSRGSFFYDAELEIQGGHFGHKHISAWQLAGFAGYRWNNLPLHPRVQVRVNVGSGDHDSTDNMINLFRPLVTKSPIHDLLANGCGNLFIVSPEAEFRVLPKVQLIIRYFMINRMSASDGIYTVDMEHLVREPDPAYFDYGMHVDDGITGELAWTPTKHFAANLSAGYFVAGNYVVNTGLGKSQFPMALKLTYRF